MSLQQTVALDVEGIEEPVQVTYDARDMRAYEGEFGVSMISTPSSISMLTWLGWHGAKRQGLLNGSHDTYVKFDALCTGVVVVKAVDAANPPRPGRTRKSRSDA